ncbi:hypothetical protein TRVL_03901 [Trypanosoma vivax]|nr:hypothetical protein TRVL_03901 [Trypanosoma vivax]
MSKRLRDVYPDDDDAVCGVFFQSTDVSERLWYDLSLVAQSDEQTFWTVVSNHRLLQLVLSLAVEAVDRAHSSALSRRCRLSDELSVTSVLVRLATATQTVLSAGVAVQSLVQRIGEVVTPALLMPASLVMMRHSGLIASATVTSLFLSNPLYLCAMSNTISAWCGEVSSLAVRCVDNLSVGRHQRLGGDVISLFEDTYRRVKHLWSLAHCAPFVADYIPLSRVLGALRVVVDLISPALQHFVLTCPSLSNHRSQLSRANSATVNAALNTATILVLFRTFRKVSGGARFHCVEGVVTSTYEALVTYITEKTCGLPATLLSGIRQPLTAVMHGLVPPLTDDDDLEIGRVLRLLGEPAHDCRDFAAGFAGARPRYFELLLAELVRQGVHIDSLLNERFVTTLEAEELGASERSIALAIAGIRESLADDADIGNDAISSACVSPSVPASNNPLVNVILEVMPHFSVKGIEAALCYYNNDVEQFILDASIDNIAPHIMEELVPPCADTCCDVAQGCEARSAGAAAAKEQKQTITAADYDNELSDIDLSVLIGRDLFDALNDNEATANDQGKLMESFAFKTLRADDTYRNALAAPGDDGVLKEKILMLMELMYEDEFDDAQEVAVGNGHGILQDEMHQDVEQQACGNGVGVLPASVKVGEEGQEEEGEGEGEGPAAAGAGMFQPFRPRTHYDVKRFHEERVKASKAKVTTSKGAGVEAPAYTKKKKAVYRKAHDRGAITRAAKSGRFGT